MIIELPHNQWTKQHQGKQALTTVFRTEAHLDRVVGRHKHHHLSHQDITLPWHDGALGTCSLLFSTANQCYDNHLAFSLSPEVVWYTVLSSVAECVRQNPTDYAHLFTAKADGKQIVRVEIDAFVYGQPNDWTAGIAQFEGAIRKMVPEGIMDRMLLPFTTATPVTTVALLLAFMDAASPFYDYRMRTRCGIPRIRLEGTPEDWSSLYEAAVLLSVDFDKHLGPYFASLLPVLEKIVATQMGIQDLPFWDQMFKVNDGSGGPYITGWLTTLLAYEKYHDKTIHLRTSYKWDGGWGGLVTSNIVPHIALTPFIWEYLGRNIDMKFCAGILGVDFDGEFYSPQLGFAVLEPMIQVAE